jgi:transcriptional regulator with XRE-family HTH domain
MREPEPTIRSRELGLALLRAAEAKGFSRNDVAAHLDWSVSKVSRLFNGIRGYNSIEDVSAVLAICDITGPKRDELLDLSRHASERGWWQEFGDRVPPELATLSEYEDAALVITSFENTLVPGLLQVPAYVRRLAYRTPAIPAREIPDRIEARTRRQNILNRRFAARCRFFIDEYALSRTGPGREIMSDQIHHLLRMSVRPHIEIRIIPEAVGLHPARMPFQMMEFNEFRPIVFLENHTSFLFLERPDNITEYRRVTECLGNVALDRDRSRAWLATLAAQLGEPREEHDDPATPLEEEFLL